MDERNEGVCFSHGFKFGKGKELDFMLREMENQTKLFLIHINIKCELIGCFQ